MCHTKVSLIFPEFLLLLIITIFPQLRYQERWRYCDHIHWNSNSDQARGSIDARRNVIDGTAGGWWLRYSMYCDEGTSPRLTPFPLGWPLGLWGNNRIQAFAHQPWWFLTPCCPATTGSRACWIPYLMAKWIAGWALHRQVWFPWPTFSSFGQLCPQQLPSSSCHLPVCETCDIMEY